MKKYNPKDKYLVSWKIKGIYKDGRYYPNKTEQHTDSWRRYNNRGILKGARGFKSHLEAVYGKSRLKRFSIKKIKR